MRVCVYIYMCVCLYVYVCMLIYTYMCMCVGVGVQKLTIFDHSTVHTY